MPEMICHCGKRYRARMADLRRGWGYSCSKRCAAIRRDFGRAKAKCADGSKVRQIQKPPVRVTPVWDAEDIYDIHPLSSEGLGQDGFGGIPHD